MESLGSIFQRAKLERRRLLLTSLAGLGAAGMTGLAGRRAFGQDQPQLANSLRSLTNPYHASFAKGGEMFAQSVGAPYEVLVTEGNSEKGISDVRALLAKSGGNLALCIDPNDTPDTRVIVEACAKAGASVVTIWNKPADLHPWDFDPSYVAHISFDGAPYGKQMAETLIEKMGGSGGIVALGGIFNNTPAIERKQGLDEALAANPNVQLLDFQVADWLETKSFEITQAWLTRFGSDIKGIWAANDGMALGAIEALRAEGLAGSIPVTGIDGIRQAVDAVKSGEMVGTVDWDPIWVGGMGLSIAYHAHTKKIDIAKEPHLHREFYGTGVPITYKNVDEYIANYIDKTPTIDWNDLWGRVSGQIRAG
jgi:ribose transport system substrate-binding protein